MNDKNVLVYVEINEGSQVKYELDAESNMLMVDRVLHTPMAFPFNYGYVVGSKGEDGDPTDIVLLCSAQLSPGVGIKAKLIGMLEMSDEEGVDTKLIAVPISKVDPHYGKWDDVSDIPDHQKDKIKHFFDHYKDLEPGKFVKTGDFKSSEEAAKILAKDLKRGGS